MTTAELAKQNFLNGCNCAQAVLLAFSDETGLDRATALRLASGLGGGMARMREAGGFRGLPSDSVQGTARSSAASFWPASKRRPAACRRRARIPIIKSVPVPSFVRMPQKFSRNFCKRIPKRAQRYDSFPRRACILRPCVV